jgi:hypothetical protein
MGLRRAFRRTLLTFVRCEFLIKTKMSYEIVYSESWHSYMLGQSSSGIEIHLGGADGDAGESRT